MARIRSIKPEFWTDEKVVAISPLARLVFIGLWNFVDDYGRAPYSPARLKMQILPADPADILEILGEIRRASLITVYQVDGKEFLEVSGFVKHQKVDKRAASKHPAPPISPESPRNVPLDQGREGKGREEDAAPSAAAPNSEEVELFRRGKQILGGSSGGLIKNLIKAKQGSFALARAAIETSSTKENPREYIGAILGGTGPPDDARARGDAW
jgi:hypothetical protein